MAAPRIAFVLPSYEAFDYARRTLLSLFKYTPDTIAIVVDDASPHWNDDWYRDVGGSVVVYRYEQNGGITRSWNKGLQLARELGAIYSVAGNNDVLLTDGWFVGMLDAVEAGYALVGPLSNAPGLTAGKLQDISTYVPNYFLTDSSEYNNTLARELRKAYAGKTIVSPVNGFFMLAKTATWFNFPYRPGVPMCPFVQVMPSGRRNPTPTMTGQEDELQHRWRKIGLKSAVVLDSFIFHYRSVARGMKHVKGNKWLRISDSSDEV